MFTENLKNYKQFIEVWNTGHMDLLDDIVSADVVYHTPPFPDMNREALEQFMVGFRKAFPDFCVTTNEDIGAGNTTAHRWTWRGTFSGESPVLPAPPTGKQATGPGCHVIHWADGKAVEMWHHGDWLGALQQVGIIPPLGG